VIDPRLLGAFLLPPVLGYFLYPPFIRAMQRLRWGQEIRPEGPEDHLSKKGTPTMGGAVLLGCFISVLIWTWPPQPPLLVLLAYTLVNGLVGFLDDFTQVAKKRSLGLKARQKLVLQLVLGAALAWYVINLGPVPGDRVWLPCLGWVTAPALKWALALLVTVGACNAVNLTDGLDGLAGGTAALACLAYIPVCYLAGQPQLAVAAATLAGACVGFLWFNCFPARVFMGDTGALALGSALAALALLTGTEVLLVVVGGVFVVEALSVMLQVSYFKLTGGRRIFRMSPIHHHFCKLGLHEVQVTTRLWIVAALLAAIGSWGYVAGSFGGRGLP